MVLRMHRQLIMSTPSLQSIELPLMQWLDLNPYTVVTSSRVYSASSLNFWRFGSTEVHAKPMACSVAVSLSRVLFIPAWSVGGDECAKQQFWIISMWLLLPLLWFTGSFFQLSLARKRNDHNSHSHNVVMVVIPVGSGFAAAAKLVLVELHCSIASMSMYTQCGHCAAAYNRLQDNRMFV